MARVTLINPQIAINSWNTPFIMGLDSTSIHLGLAHLSSSLKADGHDVQLIDLRLLKGWKDYKRLLVRQKPEFLEITMHTCEYEIAIQCCQRAKELDPNIITVVGGIHPTMFPKECLRTGVVDFVIRGEGELSFPKLIETPKTFPSFFWGETPNLDILPFPDRDLWLDYEKRIQFPFFITKEDPFLSPMIEMLTGRGCPWSCRFCCGPGEKNLYTIKKGDKRIPYIRQRSVPNVMEELTQLYDRYKFRGIAFHDDQFVINPKWVKDFCQAMHEHGFIKNNVKWWAASRADIIIKYPELFAEMKGAGLKMLSVGFESFSDRILKWLNKGTTVADNYAAAKILRKLGIQIYSNVIFGIPYSDGRWYREDDIKTAKAISIIKPEILSSSFFTPVPGSYLYEFCKDNNLMLSSASLGSRSPNENKIKGVDYKFLNKLVFGGIPGWRVLLKFIQKTPLLYNIALKIRHNLPKL
jgi:anaerobic magnesium-protoporphyrin IX monomethyl ester cyclase